MRVILHDEIFSQPASGSDLVSLFGFGWKLRHAIETSPPSWIEPGYAPCLPPNLATWLNRQDAQIRRECETAIERGPVILAQEQPSKAIHVVDTGEPDWSQPAPALPVALAVKCLAMPLAIKVENIQTDRLFLLAVAPPEWRTQIDLYEACGWLAFEHGGGSDMQSQIDVIRTNPEAAFRTFVFIDSDSLRPGTMSAPARALVKKCARAKIPIHVLGRRAIENYIPLQLLSAWAQSPRAPAERHPRIMRAVALSALTNDQRHHYFMKGGFHGEANRVDLKEQGTLYHGLGQDVRDPLEAGFGLSIANLFDRTAFRHRDRWFQSDDIHDEIAPFLTNLLQCM